jgi:hypothetical protein
MNPFRLLKKSELDRLERKAAQAAADWSARWGLQGDFSWTAVPADVLPVSGLTDHRVAVEFADAVRGRLDVPAGMAGLLSSLLLAQGEQPGDHPLALRLAQSCMLDWLAVLAPDAKACALPAGLPAGLEDRGSGAARIVCQREGRVVFAVTLPLPLLRRIGVVEARSAEAPAAELVRRSAAVLPARLRIDATLSDTALTIKDLREISVGDVLILNQSLDAPLSLRIGSIAAGRAYPGVSGQRLGVELSK